MTEYKDTADLLLKIADRNQERRKAEEAALSQTISSFAQSALKAGDAMANRSMNRTDPPRAAAVNPNAPGVAEANAIYGGPTQPHTGGAKEYLEFAGDTAEQRYLRLDEDMRMEREMRDRGIEAALAAETRPPNGQQFVKQNNVIFKWSGSEYLPV